MDRIKEQLGYHAFEQLRELIKKKTNFNNLNADNIKDTKNAINLLISWLENIYEIDKKQIEIDQEGLDINELFKITK